MASNSTALVNPKNVARLRRAIESGQISGDFLPAIYVVEPTSNCNLGCIMCPNSRLTDTQLGNASFEQLVATFDTISPFAELVMLYFMGETTRHPDFIRLLRSAREKIRGKIVLSTNGTSLTPESIRAIVECVDVLIIPIDRWNPVAYEKIRRGSQFATVVANAEKILDLRGRNASPIVIIKGLDIYLPVESGSLDPRAEAVNFSNYWTQRGAVPMAGWLNTWAGQMPNLLNLALSPTPYVQSERVACADLWFKMVINWQGQVVLCCHNWDYSVKLGELLPSQLNAVWHSSKLNELRLAQVDGNYECTSICSSCREWAEPSELESYLRLNDDDLYRVF